MNLFEEPEIELNKLVNVGNDRLSGESSQLKKESSERRAADTLHPPKSVSQQILNGDLLPFKTPQGLGPFKGAFKAV